MSSLRGKIKKLLQHKAIPDFLYAFYFRRQIARGQQRLLDILSGGTDLLDQQGAQERQYWAVRINDVLACEDNKAIPRHPLAGKLVGKHLLMHNGIKIDPLSYYSFPMLKMLMENQGVHEPQEEKIFQEVLKSLQPQQPICMLELGAYWSFYSMWCQLVFPGSRCYLVEPDRKNLFFGKENLKLNGLQGTFIHAGIGKLTDAEKNLTTVDAVCLQRKIKFLDILHADIQGFELEMLQGSALMLSEKKIGYIFISTHSNELHDACRELLRDKHGFMTVADANLDETFSWDGILVMKAPDYAGTAEVEISKKRSKVSI